MSFPRWSAIVILMCLLVLASAGIAETEAEAKKAELEEVLDSLLGTLEGETSFLAEQALALPEDTSQRFVVKELRISGNNLVSTAKLLEKLPLIYKIYEKDPATGEDKKDPNTGEKIVKDAYDFRTLNEIILGYGREHEVSLKTIQGLTNYVLSIYREKGYICIYVYVPNTAVTEGKLVDKILPVEVLEGRVADIKVERYDFSRQEPNEVYLKESVLKSWSPIKQGEVIQKKKLDDFVRLLNLNPDRYISAVVSRSAQPDALNLGYDVYEANPWHWYLQADNAGTKDRQWSPRVGVINTNLTGIDDRFSVMYQAPWEKGIEDEYALFGSYSFPVFTPRLRLNLYSGYSQFDIPAAAGINFLGNGSFYGSMLNYNVFQMNGWFFDITGSLSHERSKVTPSLGLESDVDMDLWGVGINIHRSDDMSNSSLAFIRQESMGGSSKDDFSLARLDTDPDFTIYTTSATHSQYLDTNKVNRFIGSFRWITSDERLVPAKMTTFGGLYSVRGYEEDGIVADGGILISGQYEFDLVKHSESMAGLETGSEEAQVEKPWLRKLAPLAFLDYGRAKIKSPVVGEKEIQELCSLGVGMIVEIGDDFDASIYYGWPLRGTYETDRGDGRLSLICKYRF